MAAILAELYAKYSPNLFKCSPNPKGLVCSSNSEVTSLSWRSSGSQKSAHSGRRVHFAKDLVSLAVDHVGPYEPGNCWLSCHDIGARRQEDFSLIEQAHVQHYLRYSDVAYVDLVHRRKRHASRDAQLAILQGISQGYRTLERYSCDSRRRTKVSRVMVDAIVTKFHLLKRQGVKSWEIQLGRHAQLLSQNDVRWARHLGEMDAAVAVGEYVASEPSEKSSKRFGSRFQ